MRIIVNTISLGGNLASSARPAHGRRCIRQLLRAQPRGFERGYTDIQPAARQPPGLGHVAGRPEVEPVVLPVEIVLAGLIEFLAGIVNFGIFPAVGARFFVNYCGFPDTVALGPLAAWILMLVGTLLLARG